MKVGGDVSHFNFVINCAGQSQETVSIKKSAFLKRKVHELKRESNLRPSAYQSSTLTTRAKPADVDRSGPVTTTDIRQWLQRRSLSPVSLALSA